MRCRPMRFGRVILGKLVGAADGELASRLARGFTPPTKSEVVLNGGSWHSPIMPIFARRRLKSMLDELTTHIDAAKAKDLLRRLEHIKTDDALAAEAELSMLWAISRVAHLTAEPKLPNSSRRPDALSDNLFASAAAVIEVRALSDDSFSGKKDMDRTANIIAGYADQLRKRAGRHLYFEFFDRSYWNKRFHRERCVDPAFELTGQVKRLLRQWITAKDWPATDRVRITEGKTDVVVSWRKAVSLDFRTFCQMPPVAYDLEDNPIYKALKFGFREGALVPLSIAACYLTRRMEGWSHTAIACGQSRCRADSSRRRYR